MALKENPQLSAIEAQIAALEHKATQAGAWQNPKLQVAYQNAPIDSLALGVEPMTMVSFRLEQTVPFFGKTSERRGVVRKETEAKRWQLEEKRNQLRAMVKTAYYQLALARHLKKLTDDHIDLVEQLIDAVRIKYEVGKAEQESLLRLQVLDGRLKDDLEDFTRRDRELTAAINAALHRNPGVAVTTPASLSLSPPSVSIAELEAKAVEARPALKELQATAEMQRNAAKLAEYEAVPDPTFFAAYGIRSPLPNGNPGRDLVSFGVGVPLPLFYGSRNAAQAGQAREQARAAEANKSALFDAIDADLESELAAWSRAAEKVNTYRDKLVPEAHRTLDATFSSYQVGRADFLSLYEAELDLLSFEKVIRTATVAGLVAQATVEKIVGKAVP